jgi:hypothetical protein
MKALLSLATLLAAGCGADRPFILSRPSDLGSLYARGELTDCAGNRWNVKVLPGFVPPLERAGDAFAESGRWMTPYADGAYYAGLGRHFEDGFRFAAETGVRDTIAHGIPDDLAGTSARIGDLAREAPFGWLPRIAGRAVIGYAALPVGRAALGTVEAVGGVGYGLLAPPLALVGRPVVAAGNAAIFGVGAPAVEIAVHEPVYLVAILNREPSAERDDSSLFVELVERAPAKPPAP